MDTSSLKGTVVAVVLIGLALWLVWGLLGFLVGLLKVVLTLVVIGVIVWAVIGLVNSGEER